MEAPDRLSAAEAIEQGAGLYKDALRIIATAAPRPVAENEIVKSLTDMGYRATDVTRDRLLEGLARVEELSGGTLVKDVRDTGQKAVFQMNATLAKQILRQSHRRLRHGAGIRRTRSGAPLDSEVSHHRQELGS